MATQVDNQPEGGTQDLAQQAKQTTSELADKAKQTGEQQLASRKSQAAQTASQLADAMRQVSDKMEQNDQQKGTAQLVSTGAQQVDKVADYLQHTDINEMVGGVEDFARRQPAIFLGGAFALGLVGARFLKAGTQGRQQHRGTGGGASGYQGSSGQYQDRYGGVYRGPSASEGTTSDRFASGASDAWDEAPDSVAGYDPYVEADQVRRGGA